MAPRRVAGSLAPRSSAIIDPGTARRLWQLLEAVHITVYFAPEARAEYAAVGLRGGWMGYFASRAAPMGVVGSETVVATFHNFQPEMVRRAIPDAWSFSTADRVLEARLRVADAALRAALADWQAPEVVEAADLALQAARAIDPAGRPLGAAHAALDVPDAPHLRLWHAASVLREHRFDGHVATLVCEGVGGLQAHLVRAGAVGPDADTVRRVRGWTDAEWDAAAEHMRESGLLDGDGARTVDCRALHARIEEQTDRLALGPYIALGEPRCDRLADVLGPMVAPIHALLPHPNPLGLPRPA